MKRMTENAQRKTNGGGWLRDILNWIFKTGSAWGQKTDPVGTVLGTKKK